MWWSGCSGRAAGSVSPARVRAAAILPCWLISCAEDAAGTLLERRMIFGLVVWGGFCRCGAGSGVEGESTAPVVGASGMRSMRATSFSARKQKYRPATRAAAKKIESWLSGIKNAFTEFSSACRVAVFRIRKDCENNTDKALGAAYGGNAGRLLSRQEALASLVCCPESSWQKSGDSSVWRCQSTGAANKVHRSFTSFRMTSRSYVANFRDSTLAGCGKGVFPAQQSPSG